MKLQYYFVFYFFFILLLAPNSLLSLDTYYYWEWSRHLALSYYDGSPLIAYFIKLSTLAFGNTLLALSLVGIISAIITSWIIYKTALLFLSKQSSNIVVALWLFSPLTTLDLLKQTTYDTPLLVFWASTLYFASHFIKFKHTSALYGMGISIGLLMLSKYTGVVLTLGLFIFLLATPYRYLFKTYHLYLVVILSFIIFTPVILWNYQHHWQSFIYQLTTHQLINRHSPVIEIFHSLIFVFLPALNLMVLPLFICKNNDNDLVKQSLIKLYRIVSITLLIFYLFIAAKAEIRAYWLSPFLITSALLAGVCFERNNYQVWLKRLIIVYVIISVSIMINNSLFFHSTSSKKFIYYRLIKQFNLDYPQLNQPVFTSGWLEARMLFFLNHKPLVYTLNCNSPQNQYALWSKTIYQQVLNKQLKEIIFIDPYDRLLCLNNYFDHCQRLPTAPYINKQKTYELYVYKCIND